MWVRACETTFLGDLFGVMRKAELDIMEKGKTKKTVEKQEYVPDRPPEANLTLIFTCYVSPFWFLN